MQMNIFAVCMSTRQRLSTVSFTLAYLYLLIFAARPWKDKINAEVT